MSERSDARKIRVAAILGPTAVGKSRVAVEVAQSVGGEIISADSMQVYQGLPILTDQPSPEMLAAVPHHLIATVPLDQEYSAARFVRDAGAIIEDIDRRGGMPLLCGGTGLYVRALLGGFGFAGHADPASRRRWRDLIDTEGLEAAYRELEKLDPASARTIDAANPRRVARALEAAEAAAGGTGMPVSAERERLWSEDSPYRVMSFALTAPREDIYRQIDERVERMLAGGAVEEVRAARERSHVSATAAQAIGFREISEYLDGGISIEEAADILKRKSRRYAKRQLTWMRKMPDVVRIDVAGRPPRAVARSIIDHIHGASD